MSFKKKLKNMVESNPSLMMDLIEAKNKEGMKGILKLMTENSNYKESLNKIIDEEKELSKNPSYKKEKKLKKKFIKIKNKDKEFQNRVESIFKKSPDIPKEHIVDNLIEQDNFYSEEYQSYLKKYM